MHIHTWQLSICMHTQWTYVRTYIHHISYIVHVLYIIHINSSSSFIANEWMNEWISVLSCFWKLERSWCMHAIRLYMHACICAVTVVVNDEVRTQIRSECVHTRHWHTSVGTNTSIQSRYRYTIVSWYVCISITVVFSSTYYYILLLAIISIPATAWIQDPAWKIQDPVTRNAVQIPGPDPVRSDPKSPSTCTYTVYSYIVCLYTYIYTQCSGGEGWVRLSRGERREAEGKGEEGEMKESQCQFRFRFQFWRRRNHDRRELREGNGAIWDK